MLAASMFLVAPVAGADQTKPGAGNAAAQTLAAKSPLVQSAYKLLKARTYQIKDGLIRSQTLDAIANERTCVKHRAGITESDKTKIVDELESAGLIDPADGGKFPGGAVAGVFPALVDDGSACPHLPMRFFAAPGSLFHGHHSYPGGLAIHETVNDLSFASLASNYRRVFGNANGEGLPEVGAGSSSSNQDGHDHLIDEDIVIAAPLWHDWAKTFVFQWNADGSEFDEFNFGGNGHTDIWGGVGSSKTGAHHILGLAETMARGMPPILVIAQASAHASPSLGNEYKVVNWLHAAAIIARIDPVAKDYLYRDSKGRLRLPPVRDLGEIDIAEVPPQSNLLAEYALHNLSDADFTFSMPAVGAVEIILEKLAPRFGVDPKSSDYNVIFRNPVLSFLSAERLMMLYANGGLAADLAELDKLAAMKLIPPRRGA